MFKEQFIVKLAFSFLNKSFFWSIKTEKQEFHQLDVAIFSCSRFLHSILRKLKNFEPILTKNCT